MEAQQAQQEQQGPPVHVDHDDQDQTDDENDGYSKYMIPTTFFLLGVFLQTYRPLFNYMSLTVTMAEIILGLTIGVICMFMGMFLVTQVPILGIIMNVINYQMHMPFIVSHQLMPLPVN